MKLLMISTDRKIFEEGSAVVLRMTELAKKYDELHIIVFANASFEEKSITSNAWVYPTRSSSKWTYALDAIKLGRFIIAGRKITHITCQDPFLTAMAGVSLKKQTNIPLEIQIHTDIGSPYFVRTFGNRVRKAMALSYLKRADTIRVVSNRIKSYLTEKLDIAESKIEVRPIVVDVAWIKNAPVTTDLHKKYPQFEKIILIASRLEKEKNIGLALEAFATVVQIMPRVGLVIVGDGKELSSITNRISQLNLTKSVINEPWADQATLASYYKTADLFLLTSWYEGYGMTIIEAKAVGLPVIATDVGIAREEGATIVGYDKKQVADAIIAKLS